MPTSASADLLERLQRACASAGLPVPQAGTNHGITDGNHLAEMGVQVLDGLGPAGEGDHSLDEWAGIRSMIERVQMVSAVLPLLVRHPVEQRRPH